MLEGNKIRFRAIEPSDVSQMLTWENDPINWRVAETLAPFSKFLIEEYIRSAQDIYSSKQIRFMIVWIDSGETIGMLDFFDYSPKHRRAGLGVLVDSNFRTQGVASEAVELAKEYAKSIDLHQVYCAIGEDNTKSIRLFEKAGFIETGLKRDWRFVGGKWFDELDYQYILE